MVNELKSLQDLSYFKIMSIPRGANILHSTWYFKKKRYPDGKLKKCKVRLYVRSDQRIEGVDFFKTYAPVVS